MTRCSLYIGLFFKLSVVRFLLQIKFCLSGSLIHWVHKFRDLFKYSPSSFGICSARLSWYRLVKQPVATSFSQLLVLLKSLSSRILLIDSSLASVSKAQVLTIITSAESGVFSKPWILQTCQHYFWINLVFGAIQCFQINSLLFVQKRYIFYNRTCHSEQYFSRNTNGKSKKRLV